MKYNNGGLIGAAASNTINDCIGIWSLSDIQINAIEDKWMKPAGPFGWWALVASTTIVRTNRANDTGSAATRADLSTPSDRETCTANQDYGLWACRYTPAPGVYLSTVERLDLKNDLVDASIRGSLSAGRAYMGGNGNESYGWFSGGNSGSTTIDRFTYSNDTITVRTPLPFGRRKQSGLSNSNYGWLAGGEGYINPTTWVNITYSYRIDFSTDSTITTRGSMFSYGPSGATSNDDYGWIAGTGATYPYSNSANTIVYRMDFANDLNAAIIRGPLTISRKYAAGAGSTDFGWIGGGWSATVPVTYISGVDRIDYATDTSTAATTSYGVVNGRFDACGSYPG